MGASFAQIFAAKGFAVIVYDKGEHFLEKGRSLIDINQRGLVEEGELTKEQSAQVMARISYTLQQDCFAAADFVVEAILEDLAVKQSFFAEITQIMKPDAILTSNTSGLSITTLSQGLEHPGRFCGMHWLNPPHLLPLVEVISGENTHPETLETVCEMAVLLGKKPVRVKDSPGFIINRIQFAILREAMHIVDNGIATMEDVDNVFKYGLGLRYACMGPFEIADFGGVDTFYHIASYLFPQLSNTGEVSNILAGAYQDSRYGVKSQRGFYDYTHGQDIRAIEKRDADYLKLVRCMYMEDLNEK